MIRQTFGWLPASVIIPVGAVLSLVLSLWTFSNDENYWGFVFFILCFILLVVGGLYFWDKNTPDGVF